MMKIRVKAPWMDGKGLHKIGDIAEIETAAFNPLLMEEVRDKAKLVCEPVDIEPEEVTLKPKPAKKSTSKKKE